MPSAPQKETDEPAGLELNGRGDDVRLFLQAIHSSGVSNLSLLHPRGKVLFSEGEPARGVFILRTGKAAVSISSSEGRLVILRLAQAGDVLGLNPVLRNSAHETTVKTVGPCRTDYISRDQLMDLMHKNHLAADVILRILSYEVTELTNRARLLLLPQTAIGRLAKLLLEWSKETGANGNGMVQIDRVLTQEEMAQMICSSRETVTRLLATLSRRQLIGMNADSILIRDHAALETIALG
jgi:CRP/FNR family transcriptional regulator